MRRKGENAKVRAPRRRPWSWRRRKRRPWESIWVVLLPKKPFQNSPGVSQFSFQQCWGWTFPFLLSYTTQKREEHASPYLFDPCRLFLVFCAKGSNRSNFPWIGLPRWPWWAIALHLYGACKLVSVFLKLPSKQCSPSRVLEYLLRFHSLPPERVLVFQVPSIIKNIGNVMRKLHEVIGGMRCGPARRWVQAQLAVRMAGGKK